MQWVMGFALTLTLSPRRGNQLWPRRERSPDGGPFAVFEKLLPLLGERVGVRESVVSRLHSYGLARPLTKCAQGVANTAPVANRRHGRLPVCATSVARIVNRLYCGLAARCIATVSMALWTSASFSSTFAFRDVASPTP
jgi:hypothetical protein